ncbi:MAG TPA: AmmeMemoRadiSam system protein B [Candidatus Hydrogenedentes bacterium]|nr:AmmeMemoRadiSam system protein B [Candidatus Hydrogenedentota bacterium]
MPQPQNDTVSERRMLVVLVVCCMVIAILAPIFIFQPLRGRARPATVARTETRREVPITPARRVPPPKAKKVLESRLAGRWYPAGKNELAATIERYLGNVEAEPLDNVCGLVLPHAGYQYSGQTAAHGIKSIMGRKFARVIVIGPTHSVPMENVASVPDATHYATTMGELPLDLDFLDALLQHPVYQSIPQAHAREHSVQIEVPLLQQVLGEFQLVPIVVGELDLDTARTMARVLRGLIDDATLVVASSDFTHYGSRFAYTPFKDNVPENLKKLDMGAFERIAAKDAAGFLGYARKTGATICGRCPIAILLAMLGPEAKAHLLAYDTSGRMSDNFTSSVSYMAVAFTGTWPKGNPVAADDSQTPLTQEERDALLRLARRTLAYYLENRDVPTPERVDIEITPAMKQVAGGFVTLNKHGRLRGCIGEIFPSRPLYKVVMYHALDAALNDRRFPPVNTDELPDLEFEISVLTPPHPVASYTDIVLGKHGVVLRKGARQAVYLPQVAPEQGWGLEETLTHLSMKAGLDADAWRDGAAFTVFEATVFHEEKG